MRGYQAALISLRILADVWAEVDALGIGEDLDATHPDLSAAWTAPGTVVAGVTVACCRLTGLTDDISRGLVRVAEVRTGGSRLGRFD